MPVGRDDTGADDPGAAELEPANVLNPINELLHPTA
jgi:hypothetical protein